MREDAYESYGCAFKNEAECEEELDAEGIGYDDLVEEEFGEEL